MQSAVVLHAPHWLPLQIFVVSLQSPATWQLPVMHWLFWQMWFAP